MTGYHLAQYNIAWIKAPLDSERMADFTGNISAINQLAEEAPGFIWRHQTEEGDSQDQTDASWPGEIADRRHHESPKGCAEGRAEVNRRNDEGRMRQDAPALALIAS